MTPEEKANLLAGAEHVSDKGYREVPLNEYKPNPQWEKILGVAPSERKDDGKNDDGKGDH